MVRLFSLKKLIFKLDINTWRERRKKGSCLRYYLRPFQDDRNNLARNIDFYGPLAVILIVTLAAAAGYAGISFRALALALPLMALEVYAAFRIRREFRNKAAVHSRLWKAGRLCQERIKNIGGPGKLEDLVIEILEKIDGFSDVHAVREPDKERIVSGGMSVRALYRGVPLAVSCITPDAEGGLIPAERVLEFKEEMKRLEISQGVLVAAGSYTGEARRAALEGGGKVILVDLYRLVELARQTGHGIFPAVPGEAQAGRGKISAGRKKLFRIALSREKARGYFLSAGVLLAVHYLTGPEEAFRPVYLAFGLVNLALSMYCLLSNREGDLLGPAGKSG